MIKVLPLKLNPKSKWVCKIFVNIEKCLIIKSFSSVIVECIEVRTLFPREEPIFEVAEVTRIVK